MKQLFFVVLTLAVFLPLTVFAKPDPELIPQEGDSGLVIKPMDMRMSLTIIALNPDPLDFVNVLGQKVCICFGDSCYLGKNTLIVFKVAYDSLSVLVEQSSLPTISDMCPIGTLFLMPWVDWYSAREDFLLSRNPAMVAAKHRADSLAKAERKEKIRAIMNK